MTGVLVAPDLQRSYAVSADWIELLALARPDGTATDGDIMKPNDFLEDRAAPLPEGVSEGAIDDPDIVDVAAEPALDAIFEELALRQRVLGEAYPFDLVVEKRSLVLTMAASPADAIIEQGRSIYLACLYMSAIRSGLFDAKAGAISADPTIGNLFQICATIAAAGYIKGDAYWFGHPRPDTTSMLEAVGKLSELLKQGTVALQAPLGETKFAKDGGVDVVAWRDHHDGRPAKIIVYGQCASGMNWEGKPVGPKVQRMDGYYTDTPSQHWLPALLTPFPLYMDKENSHGLANEEARLGFYRRNEAEMGVIIDRLRIVRWCIEGLRDIQPSMRAAVDKLDDLFDWSRKAQTAAMLAV
ncbi:hypothetical protein [Brevundimonas sp.]|uniref:hypothetical protein n=1 Tax=Brevundimonas sp. TaxID=1871086 RepID=UPI002ABD0857|nr:hypothetical protein [Brevundimonas sp.]MDZ4362052.1 hypothetical protein [Brevundimonas sp.]